MITQEKLQEICELLVRAEEIPESSVEYVKCGAGSYDYVDANSRVTVRDDGHHWFAIADSDEYGLLGPWTVYGEDGEGRTVTYVQSEAAAISKEEALRIVSTLNRLVVTGPTLGMQHMGHLYGQHYIALNGDADLVKVGRGGWRGRGWRCSLAGGGWPATFTAVLNDGTTFTRIIKPD